MKAQLLETKRLPHCEPKFPNLGDEKPDVRIRFVGKLEVGWKRSTGLRCSIIVSEIIQREGTLGECAELQGECPGVLFSEFFLKKDKLMTPEKCLRKFDLGDNNSFVFVSEIRLVGTTRVITTLTTRPTDCWTWTLSLNNFPFTWPEFPIVWKPGWWRIINLANLSSALSPVGNFPLWAPTLVWEEGADYTHFDGFNDHFISIPWPRAWRELCSVERCACFISLAMYSLGTKES